MEANNCYVSTGTGVVAHAPVESWDVFALELPGENTE